MGKLIVFNKCTAVGAMTFPDRKRPALVIQRGNQGTVYGYFKSEASADLFMDALAELIGAKDGEIDDSKD
jgi:hypothetical protein